MGSSAADVTGAARPLIGVTTYLEQARSGVWDTRAAFLQHSYLDAVLEAGGIPVLLPPQPADDGQAPRVIERLDALVLSGGADVDPRRYGQEPHPRTGAPREDRDDWEAALLRAALDADLPVLGICRGAQMLAVEAGGTLVQHLPDVVGDGRFQPSPGVFGTVEARLEPGSVISRILGDDAVRIPVHHHQAIDCPGQGVRVTARCEDGTIQAIELPGRRFCLAVQWHPEEQTQDRRLLAALVDAARDRSAEVASGAAATTTTAPTTRVTA